MALPRPLVIILIVCAMVSGCARLNSPQPQPTTAGAVTLSTAEYRLGVGDVISIRVYGGEEDIRFERVRLSAPGLLIFPFGEFVALGRTTGELESAMVQAMRGSFLLKPKVWINIDEYRPFFVQGQVGRPGSFPFQPGLNVNKAVTIAGGFRERASKQKIFIIREDDKTNRPIHVDLNAPVGPGDTVTVEESFF